MFVDDDTVIYSASDLVAACRCEYALLRVFDANLGRGPAVAVEDDDLLARAAALGDEHERRRLDQFREQFGTVVVIGRPPYTVAGLTAAAEATRRAIADGAPVVYQATVFDGRFAGFVDFLIRDGDRYRVTDTKLARSAQVKALLQLTAYAHGLASSGVAVAPEAELILGDGAVARYRVDELIPVYLAQRAALQRLLDDHYAAGVPVRWDDEDVRACFGCPECQAQLRASDDLLLVAGMRVSQRAKLIDAGITTVAQLAATLARSPPSGPHAARSHGAGQAAGRRTSERHTTIRDRRSPATGRAARPDDGDLFFDFEGDPLWSADGRDWGLEYLFGVLDAQGGFRPLWAHSRAEERKVLSSFLAMVAKRRKRYPNMHIYHYAPYEKTALLRLAGRHGVGEDEIDDLLRNGVLVDLYPLVRKSIRVGAESFGLKALEPLYMGAGQRRGDVTTATDSIAQYARFCELRDSGCADEAAAMLKEIEDYNHYDCRSTRALRDWLLIRAFECGVTPRGAQPVSDGDGVDQHDQLATTFADFVGDAASGDRTPNRPLWPCSPLPAAITGARTNRSGGRISIG
ncbi:recB nuclease, TM0106 family domain protein [Mycobacterium xenopi 3993]|nr:recB nuclease, TM0106 family domain protein [Mycobacterium xenopi 3993]